MHSILASRCRLRKVCSLSTLGWWNGRHVRLRGVCRKAWGFKSPPEHQFASKVDRLVLKLDGT